LNVSRINSTYLSEVERMLELLKVGEKVKVRTGEACEVSRFIDSGGQGEVYEVDWNGKPHALKWYFSHTASPEQRKALEERANDPPPSDEVLWPQAFADSDNGNNLGDIMELRQCRFKSLTDLVAGQVAPTFRVRARFGLGLVEGFHKLHAKGLCYRDIS